jgi:hypothetical protein
VLGRAPRQARAGAQGQRRVRARQVVEGQPAAAREGDVERVAQPPPEPEAQRQRQAARRRDEGARR